MKVLIVDDDTIDRKIIKKALKSLSNSCYEIHESSSFTNGLGALNKETFDVVLLDYKMPGNDGIEMLIELRSRADMKNTAIIIISGIENSIVSINCIEAGAQDFFYKGEITHQRLEKTILHAKKRFELEHRLHSNYLEAKTMAETDPLTGVPNRYHFDDALERAVTNNKRLKKNIAIVALDLDNFKEVNDSMGHDVGDEVLVESVNRVLGCLRCNEVLARLGGDEFAIIVENISSINEVTRIANRILDSFSAPFFIDEKEITCGISIGVAMCSKELCDAKNLLKCADIAMYRSKQSGKNSVSFYEPHYQTEFNKKFSIQSDVNYILDTSKFRALYQPIFTSSQNLLGFEALIRWPKTNQTYSPDEFIPIAEESEIIFRIGEWMIRESVKQLAIWQKKFNLELTMSINVSPVQLQNDELVNYLTKITTEFNVRPQYIVLEITETALINKSSKIDRTLKILSGKGYNIALDNFGINLSSITHLLDYPISIVKIDKSLQAAESNSEKANKVLDALSLMLKKLDFTIVAEGIETKEQLTLCKTLKLDRVQGFLLGKPLNEEKTSILLSELAKINYI